MAVVDVADVAAVAVVDAEIVIAEAVALVLFVVAVVAESAPCLVQVGELVAVE